MYCICCKKNNVNPASLKSNSGEENEETLLWKNDKVLRKNNSLQPETIQSEMIDYGIIDIINSGYGSCHDGDRLIIAICDGCIKENLEDGTLLYFDNYISKRGVDEEISKSKRIYRRRTRLDDLTK